LIRTLPQLDVAQLSVFLLNVVSTVFICLLVKNFMPVLFKVCQGWGTNLGSLCFTYILPNSSAEPQQPPSVIRTQLYGQTLANRTKPWLSFQL